MRKWSRNQPTSFTTTPSLKSLALLGGIRMSLIKPEWVTLDDVISYLMTPILEREGYLISPKISPKRKKS